MDRFCFRRVTASVRASDFLGWLRGPGRDGAKKLGVASRRKWWHITRKAPGVYPKKRGDSIAIGAGNTLTLRRGRRGRSESYSACFDESIPRTARCRTPARVVVTPTLTKAGPVEIQARPHRR